ncbi:hypothetical protein MTO96_043888 [Rhipicephalus appendiculatus]
MHIMHRVCFVVIVVGFLEPCLVASQESSDVPDSFKIFENFPFAVGISDVNNDSDYECLTTKRVWLDMDTKTGEYVWLLKGHQNKPR